MDVVLDCYCRFTEAISGLLAGVIGYGEDNSPVDHSKEVEVMIGDLHERLGVAGQKLNNPHANGCCKGVVDMTFSNIALGSRRAGADLVSIKPPHGLHYASPPQPCAEGRGFGLFPGTFLIFLGAALQILRHAKTAQAIIMIKTGT